MTQAEILAKCSSSVGAMLRDRVAATPDRLAFLTPDRAPGRNTWTPLSWSATQHRVHEVAAGLLDLGLQPAERVAIACHTRMEWILADLAVACAAGATTTIYPNTTAPDVEYILKDSESVILIAENAGQVDKVLHGAPSAADGLRHIVVLDMEGLDDATRADPRVLSWSELLERGRRHQADQPDAVNAAVDSTGPDSLSTLIYTSGTTGRPKGVELTHQAWTYEGVAMDSLNVIGPDDLQYLWLPLSHVFGKCLIAVQLAIGFGSAVDGRVDRIVAGLGEVKPTFMCGAPRIFEKVRAAVMTATPRSGIKGRISRWAFAVGRDSRPYRLAGKPMPKALAAKYAVADRLVFSKLKAHMGGRIGFFMSGSAKLSSQVQEWFYSAGIIVVEGYGATETSAIAFVNHPATPRFGTVGQVTPGIDLQIADDGEILLRGPIIMRGYHNRPTDSLDADGWFHTGDVGELDADGYLTITDRKSDLIKTSGGKYVAPQKVEAAITANIPYVSQAVALGEGRKYVVALVTLDEPNLLRWARRHDREDLSYAELTQLPEIRTSIDRFMRKANERLERWETVKRYAILDREFGVEDGDVTPNMKVRRNVVAETYADLVDSLYDAEPTHDI